MSNSTSLANAILNYCVGRTSFLATTPTRYIRAWTVLPAADGSGGTEVTGGSYSSIVVNSGNLSTRFNTDAAAGSIANTGILSFPTATASWGTVAGVTIDATGSGTTFLRIVRFGTAVAVASGQTLSIPVGNLVLTQT